MATWQEIEKDAPEFAERVRAVFAAGKHKSIATLRADGSPRISGSECEFADGEVTLGMMGDSRKLADVRRDPRIALHSPTLDPPEDQATWAGDAKISGRAVEIPPEPGDPHEGAGFFRIDIAEVVLTHLGGDPPDHLVIESWHPGRGFTRRTRA